MNTIANPSYNKSAMTGADEFRILNPPKPPLWRDPRRLSKATPRNFLVAVISLFTLGVAFVPPQNGYREPLSFQIARGDTAAWVLFLLIGAAVLAALPTLVRTRRYVSGMVCVCVVLGLWTLASTDPRSSLHLTTFVYLAATILAWLWGLWAGLQDVRLLVFACFATVGAVGCFVSFGVGERAMILSSLATLNTLLLSDLLE